MAGIGFDLRRLCMEEQGLFGRCRAYATAGLVAAGPWLVTMASLWLVRVLGPHLPGPVVERFLSIVGAVFAMSLVSISGLQMAATRWLADALYAGRYGALVPAFAKLFALVASIQAATGLAGCMLAGLEVTLLLPVTLLYVAVSLSWLALVWLSLVRQHDKVLLTFVFGAMAFAGALLGLGPETDLRELLWVYAISNGAMVALMAVLVVRGTEAADEKRAAGLRGLLRQRTLWCVGTAYALSLWVDKFVFWWLDGVQTVAVIRHHPLYDACFYLGYATVVPALAVNLVHLETEFYERYRGYYAAVTGHASLAEIRRRGESMRESLERSAGQLLRVQGAVTAACCWFAPTIAEFAGLPPFAARTLRFVCIGSFCHVLLLLTMLVLLYFDRRQAALRTSLSFLLGNAALAFWSVAAGPATYGLGYALAGLASLVWGVFELRRTLQRLEYLTFAQQ